MKKYLLTIVLGCVLASCANEQKNPRVVASKGLPSELLLVVDDAVWQSDLADTLKAITQGAVPGLMQEEPYFKTVRIPSQHYVQKYTTLHSKLFVHLDASLKKPMIGVNHDVIARPQIEVTVSAPELSSLRTFLSANGQRIRDLICDAQLDMRAAELRKHYSARIYKECKEAVGFGIHAPEQIRASKKGKHFIWAGSNLNEKDLNLVLYTYPWDGTAVDDVDCFLRKRDSVMKCNIPGSRPDQWMQTTRVDGKPILQAKLRHLQGKVQSEVRGLWEMRNGALGGPFVSLACIDTAAKQVVVAEGFVYSPSTDKREQIRAVEASLRTLSRK